jgi:hypothetical protein
VSTYETQRAGSTMRRAVLLPGMLAQDFVAAMLSG